MFSLISFVKGNALPHLFLPSWSRRFMGKQYLHIPGDLFRAEAHTCPCYRMFHPWRLVPLLLTTKSKRVQSPKRCLHCPAQCFETWGHLSKWFHGPLLHPVHHSTGLAILVSVHTFVCLPGFVLLMKSHACSLWERERKQRVRGPVGTPPGPKTWTARVL